MRGVLWLLPLLAAVGALIVAANRPQFEKRFLEQVAEQGAERVEVKAEEMPVAELFTFDPNTVTLQELCRLGFSPRTAAGIIKYRERGKRFEIPEDFASCYGVTLEKYTEIEPYITIGEEFRVKRRAGGRRGGVRQEAIETAVAEELAEFDPNALDVAGFMALGFSEAQAGVIMRYRASLGGFRTAEDFGHSYVVSPEMFEKLRPYITIAPVPEAKPKRDLVELNGADSTELRSVTGIGEVLVVRIMDYRERLGGYVRVEQLAEIPGVTHENYERIRQQIFVDSCKIQKIDINFAPHQSVIDALGRHPYITAQGLRKLLKNRQLKGGWRTIGDMENENIVTPEQAVRLAPYLIFKTEQPQ